MSNVTVFPGAPAPSNEPVPAVVEYLKARLAEAERGELRAIATAAVSDRGGIYTGWVSNGHYWPLIGGVDWLKHSMHSDDT